MNPLASARIVLAVTGGIAAYKAADLASRLVQHDVRLEVLLTAAAREFVQPLTFSALTRRPVHTELFAPWRPDFAGHVTLAHDTDLLLVAPATANTIARLALGLADDLLGAVALATRAPLVIAPAMEHEMFHHPATQTHLTTLRERGATAIDPESGRLASGEFGDGRLAAPEVILGVVRLVLGRNGALSGRKVVVTAGGTHEAIDPVRFVGNRSSGLMGYALAQAALDRGATVHLISGPTHLVVPHGATVTRVESAREMESAVNVAVAGADALLMAAAVADFRPAVVAGHKLKKQPGQQDMTIELVRNPDILAGVGEPGLIKIGFAAETDDLIANASAKLAAKGLAMIVANDAVATIGNDESRAVLIRPDRPPEPLPNLAKSALAEVIVERLAALIAERAVRRQDQ